MSKKTPEPKPEEKPLWCSAVTYHSQRKDYETCNTVLGTVMCLVEGTSLAVVTPLCQHHREEFRGRGYKVGDARDAHQDKIGVVQKR